MSSDRGFEIEDAEDPQEILPEGYSAKTLDTTAAPHVHEFTIVVCFEDEDEERFLMARHAERGWELPGGTVQPHEHPLFGGVREFGEETGHRLQGSEVVLKQPTEKGRCWVIRGYWGPAVEGHVPDPQEKIVETRFVERLSDVEPLAWPEDPYDAIEGALGTKLR